MLNTIPTKVGVFGWRFFLNRLPTRDVLIARGILSGAFVSYCPMCFVEDETSDHLFFGCRFAKSLWKGVNDWLGVEGQDNIVGCDHYRFYKSLVEGKYSKRVDNLIWMATLWCLWLSRNAVMFKGSVADVKFLLIQIKHVSWGWFISRAGKNSSHTVLDWWLTPLLCLNSL